MQVIYNNLREKSGKVLPPPAYDEEDAKYLGCICEPRFTRLDDDARICCNLLSIHLEIKATFN